MLKRRLISAAVIIAPLLCLLWLDFWAGTESGYGRPGLVVCALAIIVSGLVAEELWQMLRATGTVQPKWLVVGLAIAQVSLICLPVLWRQYPPDCPVGRFGWPVLGATLGLVVAFIREMKYYQPAEALGVDTESGPPPAGSGEVSIRLARTAFVLLYLQMAFGFLVAHRFLADDNHLGQIALIGLISTVKLSDSFAFFVGRRWGTVKIAPRLSPGKTLQGSAGALVGGCVAISIVAFIVAPLIYGVTLVFAWWWVPAYGIFVTLAGMVGDLAESLLKRDCQFKDSSTWLPGLGGVLDIMDSLIFAAPVSWLLWLLVSR